MGFISTIRDIYKKGTDSFGLHPDKLNDEELNLLDRVIHYESDLVKFNDKLLLHVKEGKNSEIKHFLSSQEDACYTADNSGATLLHYAAQYHNATMTECFIDSGFNIDALDNDGNTPLLLAVSAGIAVDHTMALSPSRKLKSTIAVLLDFGANIHMANKSGDSALPIVFRYSAPTHSSIVNKFLKKVKEESPLDNQVMARKLFAANCPLPLALRLGGAELTRNMLAFGRSSVDSCDRITGETALHVAVATSDLDSVKLLLLLDHKADVTAADYKNQTPLMKYDTRRDETSEMIEMLKILIDLVPKLDVESIEQFLSGGKSNSVLALMQSGCCDRFVRNQRGETPIHFLARNPNAGIISDALLGEKFDIDARDHRGKTALSDAAIAGHAHAVQFLLSREADANIGDCDGFAPLHSVLRLSNLKSKDSHVEIVELLLQHGAEIQCAIFDLPLSANYQRLVTPILAHLAKIEAHGSDCVDREIRAKIASREDLQREYACYKRQLAEMRMYTLHGSVTLIELLTESDQQLQLYAADQGLICDFKTVANNKYMNSYYLDIVKKRVARAVGKLETARASASACSIV